ncbi:MAG: hypothetical protein WAN48_05965 [Actinomycetes bacterium]
MRPQPEGDEQRTLASWQRDLRAADKAPRSIEINFQSVRFFALRLAEQGRAETSDELTKRSISSWLGHLSDTGLQAQTVLVTPDIDAQPVAQLETAGRGA